MYSINENIILFFIIKSCVLVSKIKFSNSPIGIGSNEADSLYFSSNLNPAHTLSYNYIN